MARWFANTVPPKIGAIGPGPGGSLGDEYQWPETEPEPEQTYRLTVENGFGSGVYFKNAEIPIIADPPPSTKRFNKWSGGDGGAFDDESSANTIFTMPGNNATVTAYYTDKDFPPSGGGATWEHGTYVTGLWGPYFHDFLIAAELYPELFWPNFEPFVVGDDSSAALWGLKARGKGNDLQMFLGGLNMGYTETMGANYCGVLGTGDTSPMYDGWGESGWSDKADLDIYPSNFGSMNYFRYVLGTDEAGNVLGAGELRPTWFSYLNYPTILSNDYAMEVSGHAALGKYSGQIYSIDYKGSTYPYIQLNPIGTKTNFRRVFDTLAIDSFGTLCSRYLGHGPNAPVLDEYEPVPGTGNTKFHTIVKSSRNSGSTVGAIDQDNTLWICGTTGAGLGMERFESTFDPSSNYTVETSSYRAKSTDNYFIPGLADVRDAFFVEDDIRWPARKCVVLMQDGTVKFAGGIFSAAAIRSMIYDASGTLIDDSSTSISEVIDRYRDEHFLYGLDPSNYIIHYKENELSHWSDGAMRNRMISDWIGFYTFDFVPIPTDIIGGEIWVTTDLIFLHGARKIQGGAP